MTFYFLIPKLLKDTLELNDLEPASKHAIILSTHMPILESEKHLQYN